jgi:hypothetical protein
MLENVKPVNEEILTFNHGWAQLERTHIGWHAVSKQKSGTQKAETKNRFPAQALRGRSF